MIWKNKSLRVVPQPFIYDFVHTTTNINVFVCPPVIPVVLVLNWMCIVWMTWLANNWIGIRGVFWYIYMYDYDLYNISKIYNWFDMNFYHPYVIWNTNNLHLKKKQEWNCFQRILTHNRNIITSTLTNQQDWVSKTNLNGGKFAWLLWLFCFTSGLSLWTKNTTKSIIISFFNHLLNLSISPPPYFLYHCFVLNNSLEMKIDRSICCKV